MTDAPYEPTPDTAAPQPSTDPTPRAPSSPTAPPEVTTPAAPDAPAPGPSPDAPLGGAATPTPAAQFGGAVLATTSAPSGRGDIGYVSAKPLLTIGDSGPIVAELAHLLADAGYANKVASGEAAPVLDDELMRIVRAYQEDVGINPAAMQGEAAPLVRRDHEGIVEAATWRTLHGVDVDDVEAARDHGDLSVTTRYPHTVVQA